MSRLTSDTPIVYATPLRPLFAEFVEKRIPTFIETITPIEHVGCIPDVMRMAQATLDSARERKTHGDLHKDTLPVDSVAALMKYAAKDTTPSFHSELNVRCCRENRMYVRPFLAFLWLLVKTLEMLEPYKGEMVHRGVREALGDQYPKGRKFVWHGPVSATKSISVLSNQRFLGETGDRTIFTIELTQNSARDISRYSSLEGGEVVLPPGCKFEVTAVLSPAQGLTVIRLVELPSDHLILEFGQMPSATSQEVSVHNGTATAQEEPASNGMAAAQEEESGVDNTAAVQEERALNCVAAAQEEPVLDGIYTLKNKHFPGPLVASALTDYVGDKKVYVKTFSKLVHPASDKWMLCQQADGSYTIESSRFSRPLIASITVDTDGDNEVFVRSIANRSRPQSSEEMWQLSRQADGTYTIANCKFAGSLIASSVVDSDGDNRIYVKRSRIKIPGQEKWFIEKVTTSDSQEGGYGHS
eukprot:TRINITY_DN56772_c0_g1_i1.p1 TRINITY_DN56772_c0_g1~~TRINITY_DN56772_c0_g1_i1.p1  ORF type:complete len:471 (-),score=69.27 TRINITY_DN56772_c0_g1_i1:96-1508(-)